ncbi:terminase gpA endonuclease subunit [Gimesia algae]|uniref:Phage terminase large subunit (GpA) n=1 Tax=Gimesia algae TaxID=2527971 RepID=A0A517VMN4_9PLAN|nr:terminase gpA endonuclease subunit [Gimesia algae]QDT94274.1 Phage terminase large subunit (GpA) [Gimesia algae]
MVSQNASYADREADRARKYQSVQRAHSQDVYEQFGDLFDAGPLKPERRERAAGSLAYMCETYGGKAFSLKWSPNHIKVIDRIEQSARHGIDFAFAMPRGSGKTTIARWGVLWAILNGLSPYTVLVGASQKSADRLIKNIKSTLRFNQLLLEDYPEVCVPIRHIKGEARRAPGQKFQGEPTMIEWGKSQIVLAMIPVDYAQANSSIVDVTGIEGELRGRQFERMDGSIARPTLVLLDDPQTRESAKSPPQCKDREDIITADIKMMAGPDDQLGIVIPCTKIKDGDLACRLLDRETHPEFHGETTRMLESFPDDLKLWEEYRAIQVESLVNGGDGREATKFYEKHRKAMDKGAVASWPERFKTKNGEISAIQHAMNQFLTNEEMFYAECQNDPQDGQDESVSSLDPDVLAKRMINLKRSVVPADATMLTSFIDLSKKVLWYMVCAWADDFTGTIIDYGVWPDQKTRYTTLASARITMQMKKPGTGLEAALLNGLEELTLQLLDREWRSEAGGVHRISKGLIDEGWEQKVVHDFCRRSKHASILLPSKGVGIKTRELNDPATRPKPGEKRGDHWRINPSKSSVRTAVYDTDWWKTFVANRFEVDKNDSGALTIYQVKTAAVQHRMLLEQLTAEYGTDVTYESAGKTRTHWSLKVGLFDNHMFDGLVGCAVGASMQGATLKGLIPEAHDKPKKKRNRKSMSERQRERRAARGR